RQPPPAPRRVLRGTEVLPCASARALAGSSLCRQQLGGWLGPMGFDVVRIAGRQRHATASAEFLRRQLLPVLFVGLVGRVAAAPRGASHAERLLRRRADRLVRCLPP